VCGAGFTAGVVYRAVCICYLGLLGRGFGRTEIAASLSLSTRTIETFVERIKSKLNVNNNRELLREAIRIIHPG
jgi:DNA-binding CsgD family transcriptional regulator